LEPQTWTLEGYVFDENQDDRDLTGFPFASEESVKNNFTNL
jgi:hypothetical protein